MIVINDEYGGLYDKNETTGNISKVLKLYRDNDIVRFVRFDYSAEHNYRIPTEEELEFWGNYYYLEDGSMPLKEDLRGFKMKKNIKRANDIEDKLEELYWEINKLEEELEKVCPHEKTTIDGDSFYLKCARCDCYLREVTKNDYLSDLPE